MRDTLRNTKAAIMIVAAFMLLFASGGALAATPKKSSKSMSKKTERPKPNTFESPDFAFPETVIANAEKVLRSSSSDTEVVSAVVQLVIAESIRSSDSASRYVAMVDSVAQARGGVTGAVLYSLEAQIMNQIHDNMWEADSRNLPLSEPFPDNMCEWSGDMFRTRTLELCRKSLAEPELLKKTPISEWKPVLDGLSGEQKELCPDMYVFLASRAARISKAESRGTKSPIPFFGSSSEYLSPGAKSLVYSREVLSLLIDYAEEIKSPLLLGMLLQDKKYDTDIEKYQRLSEAYSGYDSSPDSYLLLTGMADIVGRNESDDEDDDKAREEFCNARAKTIEALESYISRFPDSKYINNVRNSLTRLQAYNISARGKSLYHSGDPVRIDVSGLSSGKTMYFKLFRFDREDSKLSNMKRILSRVHSTFVSVREFTGRTNGCEAVSDSIDFGVLPYGDYGVVLASDGGANRAGIIGDYEVYNFTVSDLATISRKSENGNVKEGLYIVDNRNGMPLEGMKVTYRSIESGSRKSVVENVTTDSSGFAPISDKADNRVYWFETQRGADRIDGNLYLRSYSNNDESVCANVYTDLRLYHPGDTVKFAIVAYRTSDAGSKALANRNLRAVMFDASGVATDTIAVTTDSYGKAAGEFTLKKKGMNGTYSVNVLGETDGSDGKMRSIGYGFVEVADYVLPKFFVEVSTTAKSYKPGDTVKVEGRVMTYSGMPVADAKVKLKVDYRNFMPWRFRNMDESSFYADLTTGSDGKFSIDLPTAALGKAYESGNFAVSASATSPAGETQESGNAYFSLGAKSNININSGGEIQVSGKKVKLEASVQDIDGTPEQMPLEYTLTDKYNGEIVSSGSFTSPALDLDADVVKSGTYIWKVWNPESESEWKQKEIVIFRLSDKKPATKAALWVPVTEYVADDISATVEIVVGSSNKDQYILYTLSDKDKLLGSRWLKADDEVLRVKTPAIAPGATLFASFSAISDNEFCDREVRIVSRSEAEKLRSEVVTFRDKITSGGKETWRFRYTIGENGAAVIPVAATMTDKALNSIAPFSWRNVNLYTPNNPILIYGEVSNDESSYWHIIGKLRKTDRSLSFPTLNTYGMPSVSDLLMDEIVIGYGVATRESLTGSIDGVHIRGSRKMAMNAMAAPEMKAEAAEEEIAEDGLADSAGDADSGNSGEQESYRPSECPVAFFMPSLLTDKDGMLDLSFTAPDFNTTWQLQLMAYDPENMKSDIRTLQTVASKKVMVQSQLPRFLRTGDKSVFAFTTFNNSGEEAEISVKATLFNPITGETLAEKSFAPHKIADSASFVETIGFTAPSDIETVGVRVYASLGGSSDGEQSLIGILPSSTPVTESTPFYMAPDETSMSVAYPAGGEGSQTMFSYCDNPVWYCVTALPDMTFPTDASILSTLRHLYGNAIAYGLSVRYPKILEAIRLWKEEGDSTLVSPLRRDDALKVVALGETPWTLDAESETLRMSRLSRLFDSQACSAAIDNALDDLIKRQLSGGAWSWCEGMRPSTYVTGRVLLYLSMLRQMDFLPADKRVDEAIKKAVAYCDKELYADYLRNKKHFSTTGMLNYMYVRSGLGRIAMSGDYASLQKLALNAVKKDWRNFSIYNSAVAAIVLSRCGYPMEARTILESLRQKALTSKERGMWFDNLNSSWDGRNKLITTMQVLEAYSEVSPKAPQIDELRQWLLIQRQTEDWGTAEQIAEVVYAILSSGSDWTADFAPATFKLNGKDIAVDRRDALTGTFTLPLDSKGGTIEIAKSAGHQSWGGVLSRRILPITEVKPFSESDITVSKRVLRVIEDADGNRTEEVKEGQTLRKGDKVRIEIMLTSQRDMDYVCVIDGRSAALSPVEQLSGYVWQDGSGYYRDVRNDCTNLFFDFLPKGITYTGYDCFVSQDGVYSLGIAQTQCLYAPMQTAHSGGSLLEVSE